MIEEVAEADGEGEHPVEAVLERRHQYARPAHTSSTGIGLPGLPSNAYPPTAPKNSTTNSTPRATRTRRRLARAGKRQAWYD
ncbi:hypothetical protein Asi02nite_20850 [Asanoa siamensis]|uniref:Uncharacterized protein n=1 Tax=Asanoa siamensis TaxID=926357 RepID=A0ABQ4CMQ8_9ACTN|nr:hypothetical protein Asi02nite_20850 [Asanoa siamensis]